MARFWAAFAVGGVSSLHLEVSAAAAAIFFWGDPSERPRPWPALRWPPRNRQREGGREGGMGWTAGTEGATVGPRKQAAHRSSRRPSPSVRRSPNDRQSAARLNDNAGSYGRGWKDGCEGREGKGPSVSVERKWAAEIARRVSTQEGYAGIYLSFIMSSVRLMPKISFLYDVLSLHVELGGEN